MRAVLTVATAILMAIPLGAIDAPGIANAATPLTAIWLDGEPGDPILAGGTRMLTTSTHTIGFPGTNLTVLATSLGAGPSDNWRFAFRSGVQSLSVGAYEGAQGVSASAASMDVGPEFLGCGSNRGRFVIHELVRNSEGFITKLAMSFTQHCDWQLPALYGEIRINSTYPLRAVTASPATQALVPGGASRAVTITNPGTASVSLAISVAGRDPGDFRISSSTCATSLPAAGSCQVLVQAVPVAAGTRVAEILIRDGTLRGRRSVTVATSGLEPRALFLSVSAGSVAMGTPVVVRATGASAFNGTVTFLATDASGNETALGSAPIAPGASAEVAASLPVGQHWVTARLPGTALNAPTISRPIGILVFDPSADTTPPSGSVVIDGGAAETSTRGVTVDVPATDAQSGVAQVALSNDGSSWTTVAYTPTIPWTLTAGDGTKTVSAKWKDSAGNWSDPMSDTIDLVLRQETTFVSITPVRILDTRIAKGLSGSFVANIARTWQVAGREGIPTDAVAVTGNVTIVGQTSAGYVSLTTNPTSAPATSTVNVPKGDVRANNITLALDGSGQLSGVFKAGAGQSTELIFDVTGYFRANDEGATYHPLTPKRILDSRTGNGLSGAFASGIVRGFIVAGRGGVPVDATAITGNLTIVGQTGPGYASLAPAFAQIPPSASSVNVPTGDIRANGITIGLSSGGGLEAVFVSGAVESAKTAHLILDVTGYFTTDLSGYRFVPLGNARVLDTRVGIGLSGAFSAGTWRTSSVRGTNGISVDAVAITGNLTEVGATGSGYLTMSDVAGGYAATSTLNFPAGDVRANGVTGRLSGSGRLSFLYSAATGRKTHVILDLTGYFR